MRCRSRFVSETIDGDGGPNSIDGNSSYVVFSNLSEGSELHDYGGTNFKF